MNKKTFFTLLTLVGLGLMIAHPAAAVTEYTVSGTVTLPDGETAVEGAKVQFIDLSSGNVWSDYEAEDTTDANGAYSVNLASGTYHVRLVAAPVSDGEGGFYAPVLITEDQAITENTILDPEFVSANVSGTLKDPTGGAVSGVELELHGWSWEVYQKSITDSNGNFAFYATTGSYYNVEVWEIPEGEDWQLPDSLYSLYPPASGEEMTYTTLNVSGKVMTPSSSSDANPYPSVEVDSVSVHIHNTDWTVDKWTSTDSDGMFYFGGVPDGDYKIELEPPYSGNYASYAKTISEVTISGETDLGTLYLGIPNVKGIVKTPDGTVVEGAWGDMHDVNGGAWFNVSTDSDGIFILKVNNPGIYEVEVEPPADFSDYSRTSVQFTLTASDLTGLATPSEINPLTLQEPNIVGYVYGPTGTEHEETALSDLWIDVNTAGAYGNYYVTGSNTNEEGKFRLNIQDDGNYTLEIYAHGYEGVYAGSTYTFDIEDGELVNLKDSDESSANINTLRLTDPSATGLAITVKDPDSEPISGGYAHLRIPNTWEGEKNCDISDEGKGIFANVTADQTYELEIQPPWDSDYSRIMKNVVVTDSAGDFPEADQTTGTTERAITIQLQAPNIYGYVYTPVWAEGHTSSTNPTPDEVVENAWVNMHTKYQQGMAQERWYDGDTNEQGKFSFGGVEAGTYILEIEKPWESSYSSPSNIEITISDEVAAGTETLVIGAGGEIEAANATTTPVRLTLPQLVGTLKDPDGNAVNNCWVMAHNDNWTIDQGTNSDDNGQFRFGGLDDGTYTLEIDPPWGGDTPLTAPTGDLELVVTNGLGTITLDGDDCTDPDEYGNREMCNNIIYLAEPGNTIAGVVYIDTDDDDSYDSEVDELVPYARVEAHGEGRNFGFFETKTASDGSFSLKVNDGAWWVEIMPDYNRRNNWMYVKAPKRISFPESDETPTMSSYNFEVSELDATISTTVKDPDGNVVANVWVEAHREGPGNGSSTDSNGRVSIPVAAGTYWVEVFPPGGAMGGDQGSSYSPPEPTVVTVNSGESATAGTNGIIYLKSKDSTISGSVTDSAGNGQQNVMIDAWQIGKPGWATAFTNSDGDYSLEVVGDSTWMVMLVPMSHELIYKGAPQEVEVGDNATKTGVDFTLYRANSTISGNIFIDLNENDVMNDGEKVTDIWGNVWIEDTELGMGLDFGGPVGDMMEGGGLMEGGGRGR